LAYTAGISLAAACRAPGPPAPPPHLLLVTLDTFRADRIGAYGGQPGLTPNLDHLAASGVRMARAMAAAPLTLPSHATLMTGLYPNRHGLRHNGQGKLPEDVVTLASRLSAAGYRSAAFVGAFVLDHRFGLDRGFATYDDEIRTGAGAPGGLEAERPGGEVVDRALAWLASLPADGAPRFLWVHLFDAHAPYRPPEPFRSRHADSPYDGEVAEVDAQVGRLLDAALARLDAGRTLVAVVGDHGEGLGDHGEPKHGLLLYESTLAVPWLLAQPERLPAGATVETPVGLADVAPTLAALCGVGWTSEPLDGRDLAEAILAGREPEVADLYAETEYPRLYGWSPLAALRRGSSKWIVGARAELFDLAADPLERHDLSGEERRKAAELDRALEALREGSRSAPGPVEDAETRARLAALGYASGPAPAGSPAPVDPRDRIQLYGRLEAAREAMEAGRLDEAAGELGRLVREEPSNPVLRGTLAEALRRRGETTAAAAEQARALALAGDDAQGWYNLAAALLDAGRPDDAIQALTESLRLDPLRAGAWNLMGVLRSGKGEVPAAAEAFRRALECSPADVGAATNLGHALRDLGRFAEAETAYRRALDLDPSAADAENGMGALEIARDRPDAAVPHLERALVLAPKQHEIRLNLAIAFDLAGSRQRAVRAYRAFLSETAGDPRYSAQRRTAERLLAQLGPSEGSASGDQERERR